MCKYFRERWKYSSFIRLRERLFLEKRFVNHLFFQVFAVIQIIYLDCCLRGLSRCDWDWETFEQVRNLRDSTIFRFNCSGHLVWSLLMQRACPTEARKFSATHGVSALIFEDVSIARSSRYDVRVSGLDFRLKHWEKLLRQRDERDHVGVVGSCFRGRGEKQRESKERPSLCPSLLKRGRPRFVESDGAFPFLESCFSTHHLPNSYRMLACRVYRI